MGINQSPLNPIIDHITKERDAALDALTVTQEEWLLRTKALEIQNHRLKLLVSSLFEKIKHGDEEHQIWLNNAIEKHFEELK